MHFSKTIYPSEEGLYEEENSNIFLHLLENLMEHYLFHKIDWDCWGFGIIVSSGATKAFTDIFKIIWLAIATDHTDKSIYMTIHSLAHHYQEVFSNEENF